MKNIAFPHRPGSGGPGSFQVRFEKELEKRGYNIVYSNSNITPDLIFIVGGTKNIFWLLKHKLNKVPIIFRLDGINWLHKISGTKQRTFKNWIKSTGINILNKIIHAFFADEIVYQSEFVRNWWNQKGFIKHKNYSIIYNGVEIVPILVGIEGQRHAGQGFGDLADHELAALRLHVAERPVVVDRWSGGGVRRHDRQAAA